MARPIILGVVGDSATGKTTITTGLVEILGRENVTHIGMDDYHRYDREERAQLGITPLNPDCNYMDIIGQHLGHLRRGFRIPTCRSCSTRTAATGSRSSSARRSAA
jgi:phosphoribulokinase